MFRIFWNKDVQLFLPYRAFRASTTCRKARPRDLLKRRKQGQGNQNLQKRKSARADGGK